MPHSFPKRSLIISFFPFPVPRDCLPFNGDGLIESWNPINPNYDSQLLSALFVNVAPELPFKTEQTNKRKLSNNNQALGEMVFNSHQLNESGIRLANLRNILYLWKKEILSRAFSSDGNFATFAPPFFSPLLYSVQFTRCHSQSEKKYKTKIQVNAVVLEIQNKNTLTNTKQTLHSGPINWLCDKSK